MTAKKREGYPIWLLLLIGVVIEVIFIVAFISPATMRDAINRERLTAIDQIGADSEQSVRNAANGIFKKTIVESGLQKAAYETTGITTNPDSEDSPTTQVSMFAVHTLQTAFGAYYLMLYRIASMSAWYPLLLPLLLAAMLDGFVYWKVTQWRFSFASPAIHKFGLTSTTTILLVALVALFLPLPLTPFFAPTIVISLSVSTWMLISNMPKFW
ncbi:MAG: DUF4400 domain-containing protein [Rhizobium sp.]|nr:MAG: DUF4400 domain-containing protein [Rhizobium sp.]